jgi:hypothetical protein
MLLMFRVTTMSHHDEREGLVREYIALEEHFKAEKEAVKTKKQRRDADLANCAEDLVQESARRIGLSATSDSGDGASDGSDAESTASGVWSRSSRPPRAAPKRLNAFQLEVKRQEKRQKQEFDLKEGELLQSEQQFEQRLSFQKLMAEEQLRFQERIQVSNREFIPECAKIFGAALG